MADFTIVLGNKNYSSWSMRPWLALRRTGAAFEEIIIPLDEPGSKDEMRRHSPTGKVPALEHGDLTIWESLAICEYLAELFPEARLWPTDPKVRAVARAISAEMHSGFAKLRGNMPMNMRASLPGKGMAEGVQEEINRVCAIWRSVRDRFGKDGPYLFGQFTIADAMYAPVVSRFTTYRVELDEVSEAYRQVMLADPGYEEWRQAARSEPWMITRLDVG